MKELGFSEVSADRLCESGALHKGALRIGGCVIGGALALFTIVFLMPHMDTIASVIVVVACASAIAGWVATGTELISYAGLQIAFAFFYSVFQGYAPDTDLDNVRNRVVGILFGLIVTGLVFRYIDSATSSALAALAGATIGGVTSFAATWPTQQTQARAQAIRSQTER